MTINELCQTSHLIAKEKGFWDFERNTGELLMLIVSELGEALEADRKNLHADLATFEFSFQNSDYSDEGYVSNFKDYIKDTFEDEIADAFIRLGDLCAGLDIDIEKHIRLKMDFNRTREKMHGKLY